MGQDRSPQLRHALTGGADSCQDRWAPRLEPEIGQVEHLLEIPASPLGALTVGLVDHEDVGDLHQAGLVGLHGITPAGIDNDDGGIRLAGDLDLDLADADRLDEHPFAADRVEQPDRLRGGE